MEEVGEWGERWARCSLTPLSSRQETLSQFGESWVKGRGLTGAGSRLRKGRQSAWLDEGQVAPARRGLGPGPWPLGGAEGGRSLQPAPEEALDLADGGLRTAPDWEKWGKFPCITAANARPGPAGQEGWGLGHGKRHLV